MAEQNTSLEKTIAPNEYTPPESPESATGEVGIEYSQIPEVIEQKITPDTELKVPQDSTVETSISMMSGRLRKSKKQKRMAVPQVRDTITVEVEHIMEQGLSDAYKELTSIEKEEFKIKGEQTAIAIRDLLRATHIKVKKIFRLLVAWLILLPGVNRFFLEQEAKIKTDKIVALKNFPHT